MSSVAYDFGLGSGIMSREGHLIASISDDSKGVVNICRGNPKNPATFFW
jgi:hypothetical protein